MERNYYETLGISKDAAEKEIRSAYRSLARKYHPDVNRGNKDAERQFKKINEAHETLSDPKKRRLYDMYGSNWRQTSPFHQTGPHGGNPHAAQDTDSRVFTQVFGSSVGDIFQGLFNRPNKRSTSNPRARRQQIDHAVELTLQEAFTGINKSIQVTGSLPCEKCARTGVNNGHQCPSCLGHGVVSRLIRGEVTVPAGVETGSRVRVSHSGQDVTLVIKVAPNGQFHRKGSDLSTEVAVPLFEAILGGEVLVPTVTGQVALSLPPETQNGRVFRLIGQGMPRSGRIDIRGDLYATIKVQLPERLTDDERLGFRRLKQLRE